MPTPPRALPCPSGTGLRHDARLCWPPELHGPGGRAETCEQLAYPVGDMAVNNRGMIDVDAYAPFPNAILLNWATAGGPGPGQPLCTGLPGEGPWGCVSATENMEFHALCVQGWQARASQCLYSGMVGAAPLLCLCVCL